MTQLRTLQYHPAFVLAASECHKSGYVIDSTGITGSQFAKRRAVDWDEDGMCHTDFFDSLIGIDRWSRLSLKQREEISKYAEEGRHDLAIHEFQEAEYDRGQILFGIFVGGLISILIWILLLSPFI